jgi:ABC-type transporter Mla subunit MlaD
MSSTERRHNRLWLFAGVIVFGALLAGFYFGVEDNPFRQSPLHFTIVLDDAEGIHSHSKVTFLGIPAGYVKSLDYAGGNRASAVHVQVVITQPLKIPANLTASLSPTLLGDSSIALRLPDQESDTEPRLLKNGAIVEGHRATKLEAVLPGFDAAMATAKEDLMGLSLVGGRTLAALQQIFIDKGPDGLTPVDRLVAAMEDLAGTGKNGKGESLRTQIQTIIDNLETSSESLKKMADVESHQQGTMGEILFQFRTTALLLDQDARNAEKILNRIGSASDAVNRAGEQLGLLARKTTEVVDQFNRRPLHYLMTTRDSAPSPTVAPRNTPSR